MNPVAFWWILFVVLSLSGLFGWGIYSLVTNTRAEAWIDKHKTSLCKQLGAWNLRLVINDGSCRIVSTNNGKNGEYSTKKMSYRKTEKIIDEMQEGDKNPRQVFEKYARKEKQPTVKPEKPAPHINGKHL